MEDFNEITTQDQKVGGRPRPLSQMVAFKLALETNDLVDLGWKEHKSTWSNRHNNETFTKERLTRVVAK